MQISIKTKGPTINGENEEKKIFQIAGENRLILEKLLPHSICGYDLLLVPERLSSGQRTQANKNKNKNKERHTTEHLNLNYISGTHTQYLIYEYATCCLLHTSYDVRISIWKSVLAPTHIYTGILYSFHLVFHFIPMRWKWRAYVSSAEITRELCKAFTAEFAFCACLLQTYIISASGLLTNNIRNSNHFSFRRYIIILIRFVFFYVCLFFFFRISTSPSLLVQRHACIPTGTRQYGPECAHLPRHVFFVWKFRRMSTPAPRPAEKSIVPTSFIFSLLLILLLLYILYICLSRWSPCIRRPISCSQRCSTEWSIISKHDDAADAAAAVSCGVEVFEQNAIRLCYSASS